MPLVKTVTGKQNWAKKFDKVSETEKVEAGTPGMQ